MQTSFACGKGYAPAPLRPLCGLRAALRLDKETAMPSHRWDNSIRHRYIYLLAFDCLRVYVGQSVEPLRRIRAHRCHSGEWADTFLPLIVHQINGVEVEAVDLEYAWRWRAHLSGWTPIDSKGQPFKESAFRESIKIRGEALSWPFFT